MKMILNDKQDCIDSIAKVLERTAAWRKAIAVNFKNGRLPRGIGIERLRDPPTEWSRQFEALGLNPE
jgi:hypothetical protein